MPATFIGVRHHSPTCARLVAATIESLRPAYVLVEGPADMNDRLAELLLPHRLPIAVFSYYRDGERAHASWTPFCEYSPEWVALTAGRAAGAQVRFIDLPAWHLAFAQRRNRYADADARYAELSDRLCREFAVDNVDTLWDHLFEIEPAEGIAERLAAYFDLLRGEAEADPDDAERERYMAGWVRAAVADAGDRPVLVITGGFHRPAIRALAESLPESLPGTDWPGTDWPAIPRPEDGAVGDSYLVPYSFRRLDSFVGYQSGMPSPEYYQRLWTDGPAGAAAGLVESVVSRLRQRRQVVSTADLIAARSLTEGLARLRGHHQPARTDILDGLASALVNDDLPQRLPWTQRGVLQPGTHPVVVEMVAALAGDRTGKLHRNTPAPPLVADVAAELAGLGLADRRGPVQLNLAAETDLARSRALHRLRLLRIPGFTRVTGPTNGTDLAQDERWELTEAAHDQAAALIEAGAYGATLLDAAGGLLTERISLAGNELAELAGVLFDIALAGVPGLARSVLDTIADGVGQASALGPLGAVLGTALGLWRHDRLLGTAHSPMFGAVLNAGVTRALWLAEAVRGGPAPADLPVLAALTATRDAVRHAAATLELDRPAVLAVVDRISVNADAPPDLRGAAFGFAWSLGNTGDPVRALLGVAGPTTLGDWLTGLFALAREEVLADQNTVLAALDTVVGEFGADDFLVALPALRQAFEFFPPNERATIAAELLARRGESPNAAGGLLRVAADPVSIAAAMALETTVTDLLARYGLETS